MKKIVIIGGGIAGLTAGVYAQKYGCTSEIFEQHTITGGQCTGWNRQGFHIDNCIHWLTGTRKDTSMYQLWSEIGALGEDVELYYPDSFETYEANGEMVKLYSNPEKLREELLRVAPEDQAKIDEFVEDIITLSVADMVADKPIEWYSDSEMEQYRNKMKNAFDVLAKYEKLSCREFAQGFQSPLLQKTFSYIMPSAQSMIFSIATVANNNGNIPVGGSLAMANRIRRRYTDLGGIIHTGAMVSEIMVQDGETTGIKLQDGIEIAADYVIAACDVAHVFHDLLHNKYQDSYFDQNFEEEKQHPGSHPIPTSTQVAFAVDLNMSDYPLALIFDTEPYKVGTTDFYTLGWRNYSYEKSFAPEGKTVLNIFMSQSDNDYYWWKELYKDKNAYKNYKEKLAQLVKKRLIDRFPELTDKLTVLDVYTPMTFERYCNTYHGAWMSFLTLPGDQPVAHDGRIQGLKNCFLAGMWMMPPGGLPVAAVTGKYAVQRILKLIQE